MKKHLAISLSTLITFFSLVVSAESTLVAYAFPDGALGITVLDDPEEKELGAALIWSLLIGTEISKLVDEEGIRLHCDSRLFQTSVRFGQCNFILAANRLQSSKDFFFARLTGAEATKILSFFVGARLPTKKPQLIDLKLAHGDFSLFADHSNAIFEIHIAKRRLQGIPLQ